MSQLGTPPGLIQVGGIETIRHLCHPEIQVEIDRSDEVVSPECGLATGGIRVEGKHDPIGEPAQQIEVVLAQSGATGSDGGVDSGPIAGDDVEVPLDHDRLLGTGDGTLGPMEPVQQPALLIEPRIG